MDRSNNELYHLMFECMDYGEYDLALKFAKELDTRLNILYYVPVIENVIRERDNFCRKVK